MLYSQADWNAAVTKAKRRSLIVWIPTAALLLLAVLAFVWYRMNHNVNGWIASGLLTILGGGYCIFFYGVYLGPMLKYKRHISYMLEGRKRQTTGIIKEVTDVIQDKEGVDCYSVLVNIGSKDDPEDDRLFYLDAYKSLDVVPVGTHVRIESNDRMIASIETIQEAPHHD